jgi:hypothetical protein
MHRKLSLTILFTGILCCPPALAGDKLQRLVGDAVPDCVGKWCCPDYCPKQEPCVCVPLRFGCDDYCSKKEPCVCAPLAFCCDDYCAKCPPQVCSPLLCEFLKCSPAQGCAACDTDIPCDACAAAVSRRDGGRPPAKHVPRMAQSRKQAFAETVNVLRWVSFPRGPAKEKRQPR